MSRLAAKALSPGFSTGQHSFCLTVRSGKSSDGNIYSTGDSEKATGLSKVSASGAEPTRKRNSIFLLILCS